MKYDIPAIIKERDWLSPFEVSHVTTEEISLEYQLLKHAVEHFDGDFTRLYGTHFYINSKSTANDEARAFIEHIVDPFIDYIAEFIRKTYEQTQQTESQKSVDIPQTVTATNSTIVFNSSVGGSVATTINLQSETKDAAQSIIKEIVETLNTNSIANSDDILEILESINNCLEKNLKPQKGFFTALKSLCSGTTVIASLATALIKLFTA